jgi:hypothetical protein
VKIKVKPMSGLNYALLHNHQPMFEYFEVRNKSEARTVEDVQIEVELFAGQERTFHATNATIGNAPVALSEKVFVPLTSTLSRSLQASVQAGLRIRVSVGEHQGIYDEMFPVRMLPVNEWVDDDDNRQWLPSFVYPLDPAIQKVISAALPFQALLTESPAAEFAGYQVFDAEGVDDGQARKAIDSQIEAIWSALVIGHEVSGSPGLHPLTYMNPPPTFTDYSQRLRSPSEVLNNGQGTCIDLALLLCSALEYIDVYPVMFLLEGHAMPGYWRSEYAWREFANMIYAQEFSTDEVEQRLLNRGGEPQEHSWVFLELFYDEILQQIGDGNLVPLESVGLTDYSSIKTARREARKKLEERENFHSMVDIRLARESRVTPLPLLY